MHPEVYAIPTLSVHPEHINIYNTVSWSPYRPKKRPKFDITSVKKEHKGNVSSIAQRKISKAIDHLLFMAKPKTALSNNNGKLFKFRIAFITLTLPSTQLHSDQVIRDKLLNHFLIELRKYYRVKNYIWRAEKQKNGNIHFHILVDKFIPWSELRDRWNRICNKLSYVDNYRDQMRAFHSGGFKVRADLLKKWEYKSQIKAYQKGKANDWASPNSTDIHSLQLIGNVKNYICKYITKNEQTAGLTGRLWGCNEQLSNARGAISFIDTAIHEELNFLISKFEPKIYKSDFFQVIYLNARSLYASDSKLLFKLFSNYLIERFAYHIQC